MYVCSYVCMYVCMYTYTLCIYYEHMTSNYDYLYLMSISYIYTLYIIYNTCNI